MVTTEAELEDFVEEEKTTIEEIIVPKISEGDEEWTMYILGQLTNDELHDGFPTVDGLRRITEKLYGTIIESKTTILEVPDNNYTKCTASHELVVRKHGYLYDTTVNAVVDVRADQIDEPFKSFLVATADSRAEGKAYRRLLKLKVCSAEELNDKNDSDSNIAANPQQLLLIDHLCKRNDLNILKVIGKYGTFKDIEEMTKQTAKQIMKDISNYQNDKKEFSKSFVGYNSNWKKKK